MAASFAVFGLISILSPLPRTKLWHLLTGSAFLASGVAFVHFFWTSIPGGPALATGIFMWVNCYATFKHRNALRNSIVMRHGIEYGSYGRRKNDV